MLSIIGASIVITLAVAFMVRYVSVLVRGCCEPAKQSANQANEMVIAITPEYLENILRFREDLIELIQKTDLRLQAFDNLPDDKRKHFPECFECARSKNFRAKQAYDRNDFMNATAYAQQASREIQKAQDIINQSA